MLLSTVQMSRHCMATVHYVGIFSPLGPRQALRVCLEAHMYVFLGAGITTFEVLASHLGRGGSPWQPHR